MTWAVRVACMAEIRNFKKIKLQILKATNQSEETAVDRRAILTLILKYVV
jgi:hypothetical protein